MLDGSICKSELWAPTSLSRNNFEARACQKIIPLKSRRRSFDQYHRIRHVDLLTDYTALTKHSETPVAVQRQEMITKTQKKTLTLSRNKIPWSYMSFCTQWLTTFLPMDPTRPHEDSLVIRWVIITLKRFHHPLTVQ